MSESSTTIVTENSVYIFSCSKNPLRISVLYTEEKLRSLLDHEYWWEDDEMNKFISLISVTFNSKYNESLIHPQVVVVDLLTLIVSSDDYIKLFKSKDNIFIFVYLPNK